MAVVRLKRCLVLVLFSHTDLVIAGAEVEFGEVSRAGQFVEQFVDDRQGKPVLDGDVGSSQIRFQLQV